MECIFHLYSRGFSARPSRLIFQGEFESDVHIEAGKQVASAIEKAQGGNPLDENFAEEVVRAQASAISDAGQRAIDLKDERSDLRKADFTRNYLKKYSIDPKNFIAALSTVDPQHASHIDIKNNNYLVGLVERVQMAANEKLGLKVGKRINEDGAYGETTDRAFQTAFPEAYALLTQEPKNEALASKEKPVEPLTRLDTDFIYRVGPEQKLVYVESMDTSKDTATVRYVNGDQGVVNIGDGFVRVTDAADKSQFLQDYFNNRWVSGEMSVTAVTADGKNTVLPSALEAADAIAKGNLNNVREYRITYKA